MLSPLQSVAPGLLVAMPQLDDPHFHRAVVLMLEHGESGAMGLVVNRLAPITLKELAEGQSLDILPARGEQAVYLGGPVETHRGFVLHDRAVLGEKTEVVPGLFLSVTLEALGPLLVDAEAHVRFCLGYAGWGRGQLEEEMRRGSWLYTEASPRALLESDPTQLWERTLRVMGVDPGLLAAGKGLN
ncbi:MAG: YqgE/AlgH family protein [Myxococcaceae bacterium]|nr:YqgE/AlgH family protein [Myxococcaceae bacterium]